jgi:hypothetical protein
MEYTLSHKALSIFTCILILFAFSTGAMLLLADVFPYSLPFLAHAPTSAAPLLLIGAASLTFLIVTHPRPLDLFKALLVSLAFILWGIDQLLPFGWLATTIGDVVIVLYVIDLGWMMASILRSRLTAPKGKELQ